MSRMFVNNMANKAAITNSQNVHDGHSASFFSCVPGHLQLNSKNLLLSCSLLWSGVNTKFHWKAKLGLHVGNSWKPPQGFFIVNYVQMRHLQTEASRAMDNSEKIEYLTEELKKNGKSDYWIKLILGCLSVNGIIGFLLSQISKLKANTKWNWGQGLLNLPCSQCLTLHCSEQCLLQPQPLLQCSSHHSQLLLILSVFNIS